MTVDEVNEKHPMPWRSEVNHDGRGGVRLVDMAGNEVGLFEVIGIAVYASKRIASGQPVTQ